MHHILLLPFQELTSYCSRTVRVADVSQETLDVVRYKILELTTRIIPILLVSRFLSLLWSPILYWLSSFNLVYKKTWYTIIGKPWYIRNFRISVWLKRHTAKPLCNLIPVSLVYFNDLYNMYYDLALSFHMILLHLLIV